MKHRILFGIIIAGIIGIFAAPLTRATINADSLILSGNNSYLQRQYEKAAYDYEQVLKTGLSSADLYFNLGNAYYKQDQFAKAILYYEKALLLRPGDEDIRQNLTLANAHIIDKIDEIPEFFLKRWINSVRSLFSPNEWAIITISLFAVALLTFIIYYFGYRLIIRKASFSVSVIALVLFLISFTLMLSRTRHILSHDTGIIMQSSVNARSSPDEQSVNVFVLHEGTKVEITDSVQHWKEIRIANGNKGWIPENAIGRI